MLDRVSVLMGPPIALFLARLLQLFLSFGVREAQAKFDAINLVGNIMEILDDLLGSFTILKSGCVRSTS